MFYRRRRGSVNAGSCDELSAAGLVDADHVTYDVTVSPARRRYVVDAFDDERESIETRHSTGRLTAGLAQWGRSQHHGVETTTA